MSKSFFITKLHFTVSVFPAITYVILSTISVIATSISTITAADIHKATDELPAITVNNENAHTNSSRTTSHASTFDL